ncbi:MAG: Holliday junction branch migration protein RuvA, partial [Nitrospirales bacterium]
QLYGFLTSQEKGAFVLLTGISGIGPKLALSVLSALTVSDLVSAIRAGDVDKLVSVPGIGTKSAGRIVLELKDKVERLHPGLVRDSELASGTSSQIVDDAQSALVNLGYRTSDVSQAVKRLARSSAEPLPLKDLIRAVLKELTGGL